MLGSNIFPGGNAVADFASSKAPNLVPVGNARRSTRIFRAVPLKVSGQTRVGNSFLELTYAVAVNCHGCLCRSRHEYRAGSWVTLEVLDQQINGKPRPVRARVRFICLPRSPKELYQVGVELETPANVWGIESPPEDWLRFPGSVSAAAGTPRAVAPPPETQVPATAEQRIHLLPDSTEVVISGPVSSGTAEPTPQVSTAPPGSGKPVRVVVSPDQLLRGLEKAAEKAVASAVASHLSTAVKQAVTTIENFSQASVRQVKEHCVQYREKLVTSAREELLGRLQSDLAHVDEHLRKQFEVFLAQAQQTAQRLEDSATQVQPVLAEGQGFLQETARELQNQFSEHLRETADRAAAEFDDETGRVSDRRLARLAEQAQATTDEASTRLDAGAAEARSQLGTAADAALAEFHVMAKSATDLAISEARQRVDSSLASFAAETRADWEARKRACQDELARSSEQEVEQFRQRLETILNSSMVAVISAINEHSKAWLDSLAREGGQRSRKASRRAAAR